MDAFLAFVQALLALVPVVGFGSPLIAAVIDAFKRAGVLKDGFAPLASLALNFVLYAIVFFAGDAHLGEVKSAVQALALAAPLIVALFVSLLSTSKAHDLLAAIGVGFSHAEGGAG